MVCMPLHFSRYFKDFNDIRILLCACANSQRGFVPPVDVCEFKNEKIKFLDLNKQYTLNVCTRGK
jgi:uncharacterized OB-fold protein